MFGNAVYGPVLIITCHLKCTKSSYGLTLPKIRIISKNSLNKSSRVLNFVQKSQWAHMFISHRSGARRLERLICFKYYIILRRESRFILASMLPKLPTISENGPNKSSWALNSVRKSQWVHMSIFPRSGAKRQQRLQSWKYYNVLKWERRFTLRFETAKNMRI